MPYPRLTAALLCLVSAICTGAFTESDSVTPTQANTYPTRHSLAAFYSAAPVSFSQLAEGVPDDIDILVWACHSTQLPEEARNPQAVANLRRFVERGGGLFLVSFAEAYVVQLQLETVAPDRRDWLSQPALANGTALVLDCHTANSLRLATGWDVETCLALPVRRE